MIEVASIYTKKAHECPTCGPVHETKLVEIDNSLEMNTVWYARTCTKCGSFVDPVEQTKERDKCRYTE